MLLPCLALMSLPSAVLVIAVVAALLDGAPCFTCMPLASAWALATVVWNHSFSCPSYHSIHQRLSVLRNLEGNSGSMLYLTVSCLEPCP